MPGEAARVVVVGAGVTGLLVAVGCAQAGHRVTLLDRQAIPNPASTSYDQHRVIRALDPDDPEATRRVARADQRWRELARLFGAAFYRRIGVLTAWPAARVERVTAAAAEAGVRVDMVARAGFPHLGLPAGSVPLVERDAGVLLADRVLRAATGWLRHHPAVTLRPRQAASGIDLDSGAVRLAGGSTLESDLTMVATGPWSHDLVRLPTVLYRQTMVYLRPPPDTVRWWRRTPAAGGLGTDGCGWLIPPGRGTLLKVSSAAACREVRASDDEVGASTVVAGDPRWDDDVRAAKEIMDASILAGIERYDVVKLARCHYTVDAHTGQGELRRVGNKVWARAASGGDGFRTAPLVADRVVEAVSGPAQPQSSARRRGDT